MSANNCSCHKLSNPRCNPLMENYSQYNNVGHWTHKFIFNMQTPRSQSSETMTKIRLKTGSLKSLDKKEIHSSPNTSGSLGKTHKKVVFSYWLDHWEGGGTTKEKTPFFYDLKKITRTSWNARKINKTTTACYVQCWSISINRKMLWKFLLSIRKYYIRKGDVASQENICFLYRSKLP